MLLRGTFRSPGGTCGLSMSAFRLTQRYFWATQWYISTFRLLRVTDELLGGTNSI